jgi:hypothetical protein
LEWPSDLVRQKLEALNAAFLADARNPLLRGRNSWPNQQLELFAEELAEAQKAGIVPLAFGEAGFSDLMRDSVRFNWAVLLDGTLRVSVSVVMTTDGMIRVSHAVLAPSGGAVLAAGEGKAGHYLSNTTGHYKNEPFVVPPVQEAFATIGIRFES